ncbi:MAG: glycoside hydrolase family 92 protein [Myxococcales bacterium]|nr:MAG: glycoside hydrolase family 92 protein [Myxococcales bacterium]
MNARRSWSCLGLSIFLLAACSGEDFLHDPGDADAPGADGDAETEEESGDDGLALLEYVNPFIATGGYGQWGVGSDLPGATAPFGLVKLSPDTQREDGTASLFQHCSGYFYDDPAITGFVHTHVVGTGAPDYGSVLAMPVLAAPDPPTREADWRARKKADTETAAPGYYRVELETGVVAELTASTRVGAHRYTFPADALGARCLIVDVEHGLGLVKDGAIAADAARAAFSGFTHNIGPLSAGTGGYAAYFYGELAAPADRLSFVGRDIAGDGLRCENRACKAIFCYDTAERIEAQIGVSYVSIEGAKRNLEAETKGKTFEEIRAGTERAWADVLKVFRAEGGTDDERTIFYTALYHAFMMPTIESDVDGRYFGFDLQPHAATWGRYYSDFSLWDTYRTQHPLLTVFYPDFQREMTYALMAMAKEGGYFPKWPIANGESNTMVGQPAEVVVADAYLKGIDFPAEEAFDLLMLTAKQDPPKGSGYLGRGGAEAYLELGWIPANEYGGSVSVTQELSVADEALCAFAAALDREAEKEIFCASRYNYKNLWHSELQFFLGRNRDGTFANVNDFDPTRLATYFPGQSGPYVEGDAWQYLWFAPHDAQGLMELMGGKEAFVSRLTEFFALSATEEEEVQATGDPELIGAARQYFWFGNEPGIHTPYLFSAAGRADLACEHVRWVRRSFFKNTPDGLAGNDDAGTLSAWYVWSALGLYPIPGTEIYYLACPLFARVETAVGVEAKPLLVVAEGPLGDGSAPTQILWNGEALPAPVLTWTQLKKGGELKFVMEKRE